MVGHMGTKHEGRAYPGHFPKKGERKVDGVWKSAGELEKVRLVKSGQTAADRRDYLRRLAGGPSLGRMVLR